VAHFLQRLDDPFLLVRGDFDKQRRSFGLVPQRLIGHLPQLATCQNAGRVQPHFGRQMGGHQVFIPGDELDRHAQLAQDD
jgi:hypothetical protein